MVKDNHKHCGIDYCGWCYLFCSCSDNCTECPCFDCKDSKCLYIECSDTKMSNGRIENND